MKIKVEQKHIENGRRLSPSRCPLALAIRDHYGRKSFQTFHVNVGTRVASLWDFTDANPHAVYALPREAQTFAERFDCHKSVEPFEFELGRDYAK